MNYHVLVSSLPAAEHQDAHSVLLFDVLGGFPAGRSQDLLLPPPWPWLGDALATLIQRYRTGLQGEDRRITMLAPLRSFAWQRFRTERVADDTTAGSCGPYERLDTIDDTSGSEHWAAALRGFFNELPNLLPALEQEHPLGNLPRACAARLAA